MNLTRHAVKIQLPVLVTCHTFCSSTSTAASKPLSCKSSFIKRFLRDRHVNLLSAAFLRCDKNRCIRAGYEGRHRCYAQHHILGLCLAQAQEAEGVLPVSRHGATRVAHAAAKIASEVHQTVCWQPLEVPAIDMARLVHMYQNKAMGLPRNEPYGDTWGPQTLKRPAVYMLTTARGDMEGNSAQVVTHSCT
jgi:hypothetical protein